jgi:hypothetical protein
MNPLRTPRSPESTLHHVPHSISDAASWQSAQDEGLCEFAPGRLARPSLVGEPFDPRELSADLETPVIDVRRPPA